MFMYWTRLQRITIICQATIRTSARGKFPILDLEGSVWTLIQYLKSETSEQGLFDGQIWILFMIVFGCGIIFITIGLIIVTIIKKRHNEEDHEHDFERWIQSGIIVVQFSVWPNVTEASRSR